MKYLRNNFFIAFLFLLAYLITNPYVYGWDDQHLEIPILKHLIDPSLFKGDYYVESAVKYFTCWLYPVLAKFITVKQIPTAYLLLFLISRYLMFFFVYRLWLLIGGNFFTAICATAAFFLLGRTDEFLYRSFCHEEFSFIFMFSGLYCFYKDRFLLAALLFGLGVNFHAIYNLFPMLYMVVFLLFCHEQRFKVILQSGLIFVAASLPFLCWQIPISLSRELAHPVSVNEWMPLYLLSCPQNFIFGSTPLKEVFSNAHAWLDNFAPYLLLIGLYVFNFALNQGFRKDKKVHAIIGLSWVLLAVEFYFDYVQPSRFVLDLNLIRVEQYVRFFLMGYTVLLTCDQLGDSKPWLAGACAVLVLSCATTNLIALLVLCLAGLIFAIDAMLRAGPNRGVVIRWMFLGAIIASFLTLIMDLKNSPSVPQYWIEYFYVLMAMGVVFLALLFKSSNPWLRRLLIIVPITGAFCVSCSNAYLYRQLKDSGPGPWVLLRDWEDMQNFVREHTPVDALIMTPYDTPMGGFRIHSDRKVLVCYRDCGIIGFDYQAAVEWNQRINDIQKFKIYTDDRVDQAVLLAILKYKINYVVFMKYYGPPGDNSMLKKVYDNEVFSLFQVV